MCAQGTFVITQQIYIPAILQFKMASTPETLADLAVVVYGKGYHDGYNKGYVKGLAKGKGKGYDMGYSKGLAKGREKGKGKDTEGDYEGDRMTEGSTGSRSPARRRQGAL